MSDLSTQFMETYISKVEIIFSVPRGNNIVCNIVEGSYSVGRSSSCDIVIKDERVSRQHAIISLLGKELTVLDDNSSNGVFLNGNKTSKAVLRNGDELLLGMTSGKVFIYEQLPKQNVDVNGTEIGLPDGVSPSTELDNIGDNKKIINKKNVSAGVANKTRLRLVLLVLVIIVASMYGWIAWYRSEKGELANNALPKVTKELNAEVLVNTTKVNSLKNVNNKMTEKAVNSGPDDWRQIVSERFFEKGETHYQAGRLRDAIDSWNRALQAYPQNQVVIKKLEIANKKLMAKAEASFNQGLRNYHNLNYREAIANWSYVINLVPDVTNPMHSKAVKHIQLAERKAGIIK